MFFQTKIWIITEFLSRSIRARTQWYKIFEALKNSVMSKNIWQKWGIIQIFFRWLTFRLLVWILHLSLWIISVYWVSDDMYYLIGSFFKVTCGWLIRVQPSLIIVFNILERILNEERNQRLTYSIMKAC